MPSRRANEDHDLKEDAQIGGLHDKRDNLQSSCVVQRTGLLGQALIAYGLSRVKAVHNFSHST